MRRRKSVSKKSRRAAPKARVAKKSRSKVARYKSKAKKKTYTGRKI